MHRRTFAKVHSSRLHRWQVNGNLYKFDLLGGQIQLPGPEGRNVYKLIIWAVKFKSISDFTNICNSIILCFRPTSSSILLWLIIYYFLTCFTAIELEFQGFDVAGSITLCTIPCNCICISLSWIIKSLLLMQFFFFLIFIVTASGNKRTHLHQKFVKKTASFQQLRRF